MMGRNKKPFPTGAKERNPMDITIVIGQMCVMLLLLLTGYYLFRKKKLNDASSRHISGLVANVCNPAALLCSAFDDGPRLSVGQLGYAFAVTLLLYAILLAASLLFWRLLKIEPKEAHVYHFLTVYGNVGFLGIPLVSAVLGSSALIYVSLNNLIYNVLFYTAGLSLIRKKAGVKTGSGIKERFGRLVNVGTVSALLTLLFYLSRISISSVFTDALNYTGRATTFLSMLVLGTAVAQMPLKELFCHIKDYLFLALRLLLLPIGCVLLLRCFVTDPLLLGTCALLLAVPCGNLPLMSSREYGLDSDTHARTIVLSTLLSVITIPVVVLFL